MKQKNRIIAFGLSMALLLSPVASASQALGTEIHTVTLPLAEGVEMTKQQLWSATYSDLRTEHFMTYIPTEGIRPVVSYGNYVVGKSTLTDMAKQLESQGKRVVGGINGDYYVVATGAPLGMVVTDGMLQSTPQYQNSWGVGFLEDGTAFISQPELTVSATFGGQTSVIYGGINKVRTAEGGYYLLTETFAANTLNTSPGVDVILRPLDENLGETVQVITKTIQINEEENSEESKEKVLDDSKQVDQEDAAAECVYEVLQDVTVELTRTKELKIGSQVVCEVVEVLHSEKNIAIPKGCYVLTVNKQANAWLVDRLAALTAGERVEINLVSTDERWNSAVSALGGLYKLVTAGQVEEGLSDEQAPRSAIGVKADGSTVFYTIDGRQNGYSVGASMTQVAKRLVELGCVEAVCMDGGGSTTFGVSWPNEGSVTAVNRPSDGSQRANSNAIFLVSEKQATGVLDHFYVSPVDTVLLSGAEVQLQAYGVDTHDWPISGQQAVTWSATGGTVSQEGLFTADVEQTVAEVTAAAGEITGKANITVVRKPDRIKVMQEETGATVKELVLEPGESIELTADAIYRNINVLAEDRHFVWTAEPAVGKVDENGLFTASDSNSTGNLVVSGGDTTTVIPVRVTGHIYGVENFENGLDGLISTETMAVEAETHLEQVKFGRTSVKLSYTSDEQGRAECFANFPLEPGEKYLSLWIKGDGSGNAVTATVADSNGVPTELILIAMDFTGWKQITAILPENVTRICAFGVITGAENVTGSLLMDQITTSNQPVQDTDAPQVEMTVTQDSLTAIVSDAMDHRLQAKTMSVTLDGEPLEFIWDPETAKVSAVLPGEDDKVHRLTVTVADASGNLGRGSYSYVTVVDYEEVFADMNGHWAQAYTAYLYQEGITNGIQVGDEVQFQPDKAISRGEFALMVTRWMGLELDSYAEVELPYADLEITPEWMLPALKAAYAEGLMKGSLDGGNLYANAQKGISRTEAMTILGRIQAKGYPTAELTFSDADQVPAWALEYVKTLVVQGVVGGYNNMLSPNNQVKRGEVAKMLVALM